MLEDRHLSANLSDLSTYRTQLMGIATLMIIVCHANVYHVLLPSVLISVFRWGNWGVDIFLFLSGIGAYFSFNKDNKKDTSDIIFYYKRRFFRIYIPYIMVYVPYCLIFFLLGKYSIGDSLLCLSALEYWLFHKGAWFVSLILILYLITPFLYTALSGQNKWFIAIGIIISLMLLCNIPIEDNSSTSILHNIQWAFNRVPCFIIGVTIGRSCKEGKQLLVSQVLLYGFVCIVSSTFIDIWKSTWLIVPFMLYICVLLIKLIENSWLDNSLKFLGTISLESYLTNISLKSLLGMLIPAYIYTPLFYGRYIEYTIVIVVGLLLAKYIHQFTQSINVSSLITPSITS